MTEAERRFAARAVRRKRLFLGMSIAGLAIGASLATIYGFLWWRHPGFPVASRAVIVLLVLLNARQNLRQYRFASILEAIEDARVPSP